MLNLREQELEKWLQTLFPEFNLKPLSSGASFRRYFRVFTPTHRFVAMDAPPDKENCIPFIAIANALRQLDLVTPEIISAEIEKGFLLLTDFGDQLLLSELNECNVDQWYGDALQNLAVLQRCKRIDNWQIPRFTAEFMRNELELFKEWFLIKHLQAMFSTREEAELNHCFNFLANSVSQQHYVFMHRDYHSANLMCLADQRLAILDFQDAFFGPVTYDLVSLLRDCYINWPEEKVLKWVKSYWERLDLREFSLDLFIDWFNLMGLQRHLKALLTFARKFHRDNDMHYLQYIPRTMNYILQISEHYSDCAILKTLLTRQAAPCAP